jgi:hypothetical protein
MLKSITTTIDAPPATDLGKFQFHSCPVPSDKFDESVYNLLPVGVPIPEKAAIYKSKYRDEVKRDEQRVKKVNASIGPAHAYIPPPAEFLRKGGGAKLLNPISKSKLLIVMLAPVQTKGKAQGGSRMPALPKVFTKIKRKETTKEYVKMNALENIHSGIYKNRSNFI